MGPLLTKLPDTEQILQYRNAGYKILGEIRGRNGQHASWGIRKGFLFSCFQFLIKHLRCTRHYGRNSD